MYAIDIQDIGSIRKLEVPILGIVIELQNCELRVSDKMAFWRSYSLEQRNQELESDTFFGKDRITEAIDHYNKVTGACKHD